jgi:prepilin-type N-terminal cleavage/methylation domain-containing protein
MNRSPRHLLKMCLTSSARRRAVSLIEMLVVISLLSVAMGAMGMLLNGVWRVQRAMDEHHTTLATLDRLAAQFRSDIHSALSAAIQIGDQSAGVNSVSLSPEPPSSETASTDDNANGSTQPPNPTARQSFTLILPNYKQIDYQVSGGSVKRTLRDGDSVIAREDYLLSADATVKWEITSSDFNRQQTTWQASLLISYPRLNQLQEFSDRRELRVDATSGLQKSEFDLTAVKQP